MNIFKGKVHLVENEITTPSGFNKQVIIVTEDTDKYPQTIPFEFVKDKTMLLNRVKRGDLVEISYNLRGSEWKGRYYVSLQGWKIKVLQSDGEIEESVPDPDPHNGAEIDDMFEESPF